MRIRIDTTYTPSGINHRRKKFVPSSYRFLFVSKHFSIYLEWEWEQYRCVISKYKPVITFIFWGTFTYENINFQLEDVTDLCG